MWTLSPDRAARRARWIGAVLVLGLGPRPSFAQPPPEAATGAEAVSPVPPEPATSGDLLLPPAASSAPSPSTAASSAPATAAPAVGAGDNTSLVNFMRHRRRLRREDPSLFPVPPLTPAEEHLFAAERLGSMMILSVTFLSMSYLGAVFAGWYMTDMTHVRGRDRFGWLAVPVVGPFITGATLGPNFNDGDRAPAYFNGALQTLSVAMLIGTAIGRHDELAAAHAAPPKTLSIAPLVLPSGGGLGLRGSF